MKPALRGALLALGVIVGLAGVLAVAAILAVQSGWAERRVERLASERIGREVEIQDMRLRASWPPQLELGAVRIANPPWAQDRYLVDARGIRGALELGALLRGRLPATAAMDEMFVGLEKQGDQMTWALGAREGGEDSDAAGETASRIALRSLSVGALRVVYRDREDKTEIVAHATGDLGREGRPFEVRAEGRLRGEPLRVTAGAPSVPLEGAEPVRIKFDAALGKNQAAGEVALRAAADALQSIQGQVEVSGPSFAALDRVAGAELPKSAPYRVALHFRHEGPRWIVEDFDFTLGRSDLRGEATLEMRPDRPYLRAHFVSNRFDMLETGIKRRVKKELEENVYLFPRDPWPDAKWDALDAEVELYMKELRNARPVPLDALEVRAVLQDSTLTIDPFTVALASGTIGGRVEFAADRSPEEGSARFDIRGLRLSRLVPKIEKQKQAALGRLNGRIELAGAGATPAELMANADGRILFAAERGTVSALLVEVLGLDAAEAIMLVGRKREQPLRCAVVDFNVKKGEAKTNTFVIDTTDSVLSVEGSANLGKETLNLTARVEPRDASAFSLRTPANITGTFLEPKVRPQAGPLAGRAAAVVGLALVNPVLALIPFVDLGGDPEPGCQPQKR